MAAENHSSETAPDALKTPAAAGQERARPGPARLLTGLTGSLFGDRNGRLQDHARRLEELHRLNVELEAEISERRRVEDALRRRNAFEQEISGIFANLINLPSHRLSQQIVRTLEAVARYTGADAAVLWELTGDGGELALRHWWTAERNSVQLEPLPKYPVNPFGWWMDRLRAFETIAISNRDDLPPEAENERRAMQDLGVRSVLAVPVASRGWLKGFVALWAVRSEVQWQAEDVPLVRLAGEAVASALERQRAEDQVRSLNSRLERQVRQLNALRKIDICIASAINLRTPMEMVLYQARELLGAAAAAALLLDEQGRSLRYAYADGIPLAALGSGRVRLGEQLPGQAALGEEILRVDDIEALPPEHRPHSPALRTGQFRACCAAPLISQNRVNGVLELLFDRPISPDREWLEYAAMLAGQAGIAVGNHRLVSELQQSNRELVAAYDATIEGWSRAMDLRDHATRGHSERVAALTVRVARRLGVPDEELVHIRRGALLHDIGKMATPDFILLKPGSLTPEERAVMELHTTHAYDMLSPIEFLRPALDIPLYHHERWDGTGYPNGLSGEQIPVGARVFAVVDVFDALTSHRPYRPAWPREKALEHICSLSGTHFDPRVVEAFMQELMEQEGEEPEEDGGWREAA